MENNPLTNTNDNEQLIRIKNVNSPDAVIQGMYLEITNIAQGVNIALLVYVVTSEAFLSTKSLDLIAKLFLAITSLFICALFWIRYYLDTKILDRSFTVSSVVWFFAYIAFQGISVAFINLPNVWFVSTGIFLFFGSGFYQLNLREMKRKQKANVLSIQSGVLSDYLRWQTQRMKELLFLSIFSILGAIIITIGFLPLLIASAIALGVSVWQLVVCRDYRKFINTGI